MDLVIRGGRIADGLGGPIREADVAVKDGRLACVGVVPDKGTVEIDARGLLVTPGFVDIHTHYDGQAMWDSRFQPSSWHGVTTAVMGNCGVGFAPVRPSDCDRLVELMEGVEDIPGTALHEGLDWSWESFGEYLTALERRPHDIDFCAQLPHGALRVYVMGERATRLEMATPEDIAQMRSITAEAVRAGALGVSTSRSINHRTSTGDPTPSLRAAEDELMGLALGLRDAGAGVLQIICDFEEDVEGEFAMMRRLVEASQRPLSYSLMQKRKKPDGWKRLLELTAQARADGLPMTAQIAPRGVGVLLSLEGSRNVFSECPSYQAIADLPLTDRVGAMSTPEMKSRLLHELHEFRHTRLGERLTEFGNMFPFAGDPPNYDPGLEMSVAALAARAGKSADELAYELTLADDGRAILYSPFANYSEGNLDVCAQMIADPNTVIGLGDGGAHVALICDASFPTFLLTHWGLATKTFDIGWLVKRQTADAARVVGLHDRGVLAPGMKADINLIDLDQLAIDAPRMVYDLPAGGRRRLQRTSGFVATIVGGQIVYQNGEPTGALPGKLVRGAQPQPSMQARESQQGVRECV